MNNQNLLICGAVVVVVWCVVIYFWPRLMFYTFKQALLTKGFGDGPVPIYSSIRSPKDSLWSPWLRKPPRARIL